MRTRERILAIRLLEKVQKHPAYAQALEIEAEKEQLPLQDRTPSEAAGNVP